jgi:integrase
MRRYLEQVACGLRPGSVSGADLALRSFAAFPGDLPRLDRPLPRALDDASAAKLLRAAQADRRMLVRVTVEMLLRTGLRVSELTGLRASAVVLIGAGPWLHVPAGKLRQDRYLPLHPQLATLIDTYRAAHVSPAPPPGWAISTPTSSATPWPPRPSTAARAWKPSPRCSATAAWT